MLAAPIKIAVVDDHVLFRKAITRYLSEQRNISMAVEASDVGDLLVKLRNCQIDILLLDYFLPGLHGPEAIATIHKEYPAIKILVLSISADLDLVSDMLAAGVYGYISKADEPERLFEAIQAAAQSRVFRNELFTDALYRSTEQHIGPHGKKSCAVLSEREKRILQLIWEEKSSKEIADELFLGIRSVEKIRQDIKEKIGAKSMIGLLKYAMEKRIIMIAEGVLHAGRARSGGIPSR